jgi:acyl-CoA synthetase (AMP-forming)/AMP-acid ligase II
VPLDRGEVIAVQIGNHPSWPALFIACLRRGAIVLPLDRSISEREREAACTVCHVACIATAEAEGSLSLTRRSAEAIRWDDSPPVLLKLTSGTTAASRAIRFRSRQLLADAEQICDTMQIGGDDVNFAVIPISHSYGFSNLLTPLLSRGVAMSLSSDRLPRAIIDGLNRTGATVFPGMPVLFQALSEMKELPQLPKLRLCISAGAPLPLRVARPFRQQFRLPIHSFYGASECGGICYDDVGGLEVEGLVGKPMRGVQIDLLDGPAPTKIAVRSAAVGDGYFPVPDEKLTNRRFVPDDLLEATRDGFRLVGRASDLINVAGRKVNPAEIESVLREFEQVRDAVVFARRSRLRNEEVAACIVTSAPVDEAKVIAFCRAHLSDWQVPKRIFFLPQLPLNERGKVSRRVLVAQFAESAA